MANEINSTAQGTHFDEAQLMMYVDGELSAAEMEPLKAHLLACADCRQSYTDIEEANRAYREFQGQWSATLAAPPHQWAGFEQKLNQTLAEGEVLPLPIAARRPWGVLREFLGATILSRTLPRALPWALSGVAAALALVFLFLHSPNQQTLTVAQVLTHVEQANASRDAAVAQVVYQKIRITDSAAPQAPVTVELWSDRQHGRFREAAVNSATVHGTSSGAGSTPALLSDLNLALEANHLQSSELVSVSAFKRWEQSPGRKDESLSEEPLSEGGEAYRLSAKAVDADSAPATPLIRTMEVLVRASDWHVVAERMSVANQSGVHSYEIAELEYRLIPLEHLALFGGQPDAPVSDANEATAIGSSIGDLTVDALYRLDRVDALAQDQIIVTGKGGEVQIGGTVRSESRKAEILAALGSLASNPAVKLNLLSAADARAVGAAPLTHPLQVQSVAVRLNEAGALPELRAYLAGHQHVPERDLDQAEDRFVTDAIGHSAEAQLHAQALKQIVDAAPQTDADAVSATTREKLHALVVRHAQASRQEIHLLEEQLSPVFLPAATSSSLPESGRDPEADQLLNLTTDSDRILWQVFSSNASSADRRGLTDARFWMMLKEEDHLAAHLAENRP
jgi:anti-sigma factor RsiW